MHALPVHATGTGEFLAGLQCLVGLKPFANNILCNAEKAIDYLAQHLPSNEQT
jgi:hypothetical protein